MTRNPVLPLFVLFAAMAVIAAIVRLFTASRHGGFAYNRIERLFTPAERSFLGVLEQIVGTQYRIFGKIRLADIIQTPKGLSNSARASAFNRICARHVDFALFDPRTFEVIGVIELDDSSHGRESRRNRDRFVDEALTAAGVPFVRIAARRGYVAAEIREEISALLGKDVSRIA
jgi:very-short-patch-repair endonuclease